MTAHNLPYVHWLLSPLSKSPIMQFLCTVKAHLLSHKQKPTTKKERKKENMDPALTPPPAFLYYSINQSSRIHIIGRGVAVQRARGRGRVGWAFCLGFILDVWRKPVRRWPSLSCSAHHMVKQSEGHWLAAAASVSSTFIAVDV